MVCKSPGERFRGVWAAAGQVSNNSSSIIPRQLDRYRANNRLALVYHKILKFSRNKTMENKNEVGIYLTEIASGGEALFWRNLAKVTVCWS